VHIGLFLYNPAGGERAECHSLTLDALPRLIPTVSGGYLYDRMLAEHLLRAGDRVTLLTLPWRSYARQLLDNLDTGWWKQAAGLELDVMVQDELNHPSLAWANRRLRGRYPLVSIVHHLRSSEFRPAWQNRLYRRVERQYLSEMDGFIYNSQTTRKVVEAVIDARGKPYQVAYPAGDRFGEEISSVEINLRAQQPPPLRLCFLGNLIPRKGLHTLLEALAQLPPQDWQLQVIGSLQADPGYVRQVRDQAAALQGKVEFCGTVDHEALVERLHSSQVLVLPSTYEGFGIAYLEGMSFGLPAVATTSGAAGEVITPGQDGFLVEPGDAAALAHVVQDLAHDRLRLAAMGLAARRRFLAHPGWEQSCRAIREFLFRLSGQNGEARHA
jgi:glycosyltransferase involved in cell wall biosynthesis